MLLTFVFLISAAAALPLSVHYDRRQDGDLNVSADLQNIVILVAVPDKISAPVDLFDLLKSKGHTRHAEAQERADHVMDAFVEPDTPYQVEIGSDRSANGGGAVEVVIAGRRRLETEPEVDDEIKLIGATEQCGPDRERDPVTLMCRFKKLEILDVKPAVASPNSIKEPAKESLIQKETTKEGPIQKEPVKESSMQKETIKESPIQKEAPKESPIQKEAVKESAKSVQKVEKPQVTPEVISS